MAKIINPNIIDEETGEPLPVTSRQIKSVHLFVPSNLSGLTLEAGTAEVELFADSANAWQSGTQIDIYDNGGNLFGRYFIEDCTQTAPREYSIRAHDLIAELEKREFLGYSKIFVENASSNDTTALPHSTTASAVCSYLFESADEYELDESLADSTVPGKIPFTNCREALRYLCLAIGACAHTHRTKKVKIVPYTQTVPVSVSSERIMDNLDVEKNSDYATGVKLTTHSYSKVVAGNGSVVDVFAGYLPTGKQVISVDTPANRYDSSYGAESYSEHTNTRVAQAMVGKHNIIHSTGISVEINVGFYSSSSNPAITIDGQTNCFVILWGHKTSHSTSKKNVGNTSKTGKSTEIDGGATVITGGNASSVGNRLLAYMNKPSTANFTYVMNGEDIESTLTLTETGRFGNISGRIVSLDIDMGASKNFANAIILCESEATA